MKPEEPTAATCFPRVMIVTVLPMFFFVCIRCGKIIVWIDRLISTSPEIWN